MTNTARPDLGACLAAARITLRLGEEERSTHHPDGRRETVTTHTCMLATLAPALAQELRPDLDLGLVTMYAVVHDLVESYAGDTCTARPLDADSKQDKARREAQALKRIDQELHALPWVTQMIERYEEQVEPEARWVRYLDKLTVRLTHTLSACMAPRRLGMTRDDVQRRTKLHEEELAQMYPELPQVAELYQRAGQLVVAAYGEPLEYPGGPPTVILGPTEHAAKLWDRALDFAAFKIKQLYAEGHVRATTLPAAALGVCDVCGEGHVDRPVLIELPGGPWCVDRGCMDQWHRGHAGSLARDYLRSIGKLEEARCATKA